MKQEMKREFLVSAVQHGGPGKLEGTLGRWYEQMRRAPRIGALESYGGRILNRFPMKATLRIALDWDLQCYGQGFVRGFAARVGGANYRGYELVLHPSRRVLDVVASAAEVLEWINRRTRAGMKAVDVGDCELRIERRDRARSQELHALEMCRALLLRAGLLKETKNACALVGEGGRRGFKFRTATGWCWSPEGMMVAITAMKLAVIRPEMLEGEYEPREKLLNLFAWFSPMDDDARLCHWLVARNRVGHPEGYLFDRWGLSGNAGVGQLRMMHIPAEPPRPKGETLKWLLGRFSHKGVGHPEPVVDGGIPWHEGKWLLFEQYQLPCSRSCMDLAYSGVTVQTHRFYTEDNHLITDMAVQLPGQAVGSKKLHDQIEGILGARIRKRGTPEVWINTNWVEATPGAAKKLRRMFLLLPFVTKIQENMPEAWMWQEKPRVKMKSLHKVAGKSNSVQMYRD